MAQFPDTIHFTGLNKPIGIEWSARNLDVIGEIPADIDGAFFRAVPDPPMRRCSAMTSRFRATA
ncbi:carotenoid oxygenase family protein [Novosphingobium sp. ST904]|uniref:carotenoid oxygenase family protein n=1 Tax=Novosphingobium sp. ST904 TaxID=1684385 RepID=UPI000A84B22A|nr:carotenoid oxygenase family protein [Novosphingobium sp. ST904]